MPAPRRCHSSNTPKIDKHPPASRPDLLVIRACYAATAEISRAQVWQWVRHQAKLADGRVITKELVIETMKEELEKLKGMLGAARFQNGKFELAAQLFEPMMTSQNFDEFLTLAAYRNIQPAGAMAVGRAFFLSAFIRVYPRSIFFVPGQPDKLQPNNIGNADERR
jgi:Malate synthase